MNTAFLLRELQASVQFFLDHTNRTRKEGKVEIQTFQR
jgi:hypothetical protein